MRRVVSDLKSKSFIKSWLKVTRLRLHCALRTYISINSRYLCATFVMSLVLSSSGSTRRRLWVWMCVSICSSGCRHLPTSDGIFWSVECAVSHAFFFLRNSISDFAQKNHRRCHYVVNVTKQQLLMRKLFYIHKSCVLPKAIASILFARSKRRLCMRWLCESTESNVEWAHR